MPDSLDPNAVASLLSDGGIIAYPTEAVWGVGCDPFNELAVKRILNIKQRSIDKGLIIVAADISQIDFLLKKISDDERQALLATWPGPCTWLIEDVDNLVPHWIKGKFTSFAVRVSAHHTVQALCHAFGGPIVSTSANPAGLAPAVIEQDAREYFSKEIDCYVSGQVASAHSRPSTIRRLSDGTIIR